MKITTSKSMIAGVVVALLTLLQMAALAQTRPRPQIRTNNPASYRYAYEHGYRAGYEDGYENGKRDFDNNQPRDFARFDEYERADRTYERRMGDLREYQDGYQAGFELAYNDGFYGRPYSISIPGNLGQIVSNNNPVASRSRTDDRRDTRDTRADDRYDNTRQDRSEVTVAADTELRVRLTSQIHTKVNREGDQFTATVIDPRDLSEATITGHIASLKRSGRVTGKTELTLAFDSITLRDGRSGRFDAQVTRVLEGETVKTVDEEGNVQSSNRTKDTATRSVGGAAVGAIIGAIAGGGKGAAIGAAIGATVGAGSVVIEGNKDLILDPGTEMIIRATGPDRR